MITTPFVRHILSDKLKDTLPVCIRCNKTFHPNGRGIVGEIFIKDDCFFRFIPDKFVECK